MHCRASDCNFERQRIVTPPKVSEIQSECDEIDKISLSFLFYGDPKKSFDICQKCLDSPDYKFLEDHLTTEENWETKLLESLFHIKQIYILNTLGINKYDASVRFTFTKSVPKCRVLLYKICESLNTEETMSVMNSISTVTPEKYLEMYLLKIILSEKDILLFLDKLHSFDNADIEILIEELQECFTVNQARCKTYEKRDILNSFNTNVKLLSPKVYTIKDPNNVGLCLIVNEVNFEGQQRREGSFEDVSLLDTTMKYFNFNIKVFTDVTAKFFECELSKQIQENFKEYHSVFFMVILSHGTQGTIRSSDGKDIPISFIISKLDLLLLKKIPKVLVIQACQGEIYLRVDEITTDGPSDLNSECRHGGLMSTHISDFLLASATVPGFRAFRDKQKGTYFIQILCRCLMDYQNSSFFEILTETIRCVKEECRIPGNKFCFSQQSVYQSMFEKQLYLKPLERTG